MDSKVERDIEMKVPKQALYQAIIDFESYPKFLPEVVGARRLSGASSDRIPVEFEIEVVKRFQYSLEFHLKGKDEVRWKLLESNFFRKNQGLWRLGDKGANLTAVRYELEVAFGFLVPGWVSKKLTEVNLPKMFDAFEGHAREISQRG